ncbi:hypothetical protein WJX73_009616 [Symbiochloris irregularis]|uniref:Uncharacterized protein n=1 Tax=Symbiochloris irregularis TaxID=706552 RepID=A0AAW1PNE9_9CHLO
MRRRRSKIETDTAPKKFRWLASPPVDAANPLCSLLGPSGRDLGVVTSATRFQVQAQLIAQTVATLACCPASS